MQDQQNAACLGEVEGVVNTGNESQWPSGCQERRPFFTLDEYEDVNVFGEARSPENRGGDSTDDRAGRGGGIEPIGHRAERLNERRRRIASPPAGATLRQALPF